LLLSNKAALERRLSSFKRGNTTFVETFKPRHAQADGKEKARFPRRKRAVLEVANGFVLQTLADVDTAASTIGTGRFNMYNIIKTGRLFKEKSYVYGSTDSIPANSEETTGSKNDDRRQDFLPENRVHLVDFLRHSSVLSRAGIQLNGDANKTYLAAFVSGRTYPPERASDARGRRKEGGLSIYFPQLRGRHIGEKLLRAAAERCFAYQVMPNSENGTRYCDGLILLGYNDLRPSRNRCGLHVCNDVLRVILELLRLDSSCPELQNSTIEVDIFTDSNYAWDLLHNTTSLLRWGSYSRKHDFVYDGKGPKWKANPDILYPLSRTYYGLVNQVLVQGDGNSSKSLAKDLQIRFRHQSEVEWTWDDPTLQSIDVLAERAAHWQYERV
jgi:hypothetical protein